MVPVVVGPELVVAVPRTAAVVVPESGEWGVGKAPAKVTAVSETVLVTDWDPAKGARRGALSRLPQ